MKYIKRKESYKIYWSNILAFHWGGPSLPSIHLSPLSSIYSGLDHQSSLLPSILPSSGSATVCTYHNVITKYIIVYIVLNYNSYVNPKCEVNLYIKFKVIVMVSS